MFNKRYAQTGKYTEKVSKKVSNFLKIEDVSRHNKSIIKAYRA
jgi:hypothetical protein